MFTWKNSFYIKLYFVTDFGICEVAINSQHLTNIIQIIFAIFKFTTESIRPSAIANFDKLFWGHFPIFSRWFLTSYLLLAMRRHVPERVSPALAKSGDWKRHRTWYQWVRGSVGAVESQTVILIEGERQKTVETSWIHTLPLKYLL